MTPLLFAQSFTPSTTSVAGNVFLTAIVGLLPLILFFVLMGVFKVATHWCSIISLVLSLGIAVFAFKMPVGMALLSGTQCRNGLYANHLHHHRGRVALQPHREVRTQLRPEGRL